MKLQTFAIAIIIFLSLLAHGVIWWLSSAPLQDLRWINEPVHSSLEMLGTAIALVVAWSLLDLNSRGKGSSYNVLLAAAIVAMGILDGFHALTGAGNTFVWLHSIATLVGGALFSAILFTPQINAQRQWHWVGSIALLACLLGFASIAVPNLIPNMVVDGQFTLTAKAINIGGGILFIVAAIPLLRGFFQKQNNDDFLFCLHCILFGAAALMFEQSRLWDVAWWGWHFLRFAAYAVALVFVLLNNSIGKTTYIESLKSAVDERTKNLEKAYEEQIIWRNQFQDMLKSSPNAILLADNEGRIQQVNPAFVDIFGYTQEEIINKPVELLLPKTSKTSHKKLRDGFIKNPEIRPMGKGRDLKALTKSGDEIDVEIALLPTYIDGLNHIMVEIHDVTFRRQMESANLEKTRALEKSAQRLQQACDAQIAWEQQFRTMVHSSPNAIVMADHSGQVLKVNPTLLALFGYNEEEIVGQPVETLLPDAIRHAHSQLRQDFVRNPKIRPMGQGKDLKAKHKNGGVIDVEIALVPVTIDGQALVMVEIHDVTLRKQMEKADREKTKALEASAQQLSESNASLERFAYICSHDLQEPVRTVQSFSELLERHLQKQEAGIDAKTEKYLRHIIDGSQRSRELIADVLKFCRLENDTNAFETISLTATCKQVKESIQTNLRERDAELLWQTAPPLPSIEAIPGQIRQLLLNLVNNGIKFNQAEHPRVVVSAEDNGDFWSISISDNGIGIPAEQRAECFEIFKRLNKRSDYPGTGLGLSICKKVIQNHGGRIRIEDSSHGGTAFIIEWPKYQYQDDNQLSEAEKPLPTDIMKGDDNVPRTHG